MPCNGIAVATAKISNDLTEYLALLPEETINQAIQAYIKAQFPGLSDVGGSIYRGWILVSVTPFTVEVNPQTGEVRVSSRLSANSGVRDQLKTGIINLLTGLAGYALQQQFIGKVSGLARITGQQTATNGAVVLSVEL